jgi:hypothetical protein
VAVIVWRIRLGRGCLVAAHEEDEGERMNGMRNVSNEGDQQELMDMCRERGRPPHRCRPRSEASQHLLSCIYDISNSSM